MKCSWDRQEKSDTTYYWRQNVHFELACFAKCGNTYKEGGEEDGRQGDQGRQHHLGGNLGAAAAHDGGENLKHDPYEEHEVDVRQGQAQQIEHAVL